MKTTTQLASLSTLSLVLSACGGGGGGGGGTLPTFTSWSAIQPGSTVVATGLSQETPYAYDESGLVIDAGQPSSVSTTSTATMTFDSAGDLSGLTLVTPTSKLDLGVFVDLGEGVILAANSADPALMTSLALIADPYFLGYEYQSFGIWETTLVGTNNAVGGVFSVGAPTAGSAIPTVGDASFVGNLAGSYIDPGGVLWFAFADVNVNANFGTRTLTFSSASTSITDLLTPEIPRPDLDLAGTFAYQPAVNAFTGPVTSGITGLSGSSTGRFYGPGAQELGGVFTLRSDGVESYGGAYGAVRTPAP